jgi:hypothetical protein
MKTYIGIRENGPGSCIVSVRDTETPRSRRKRLRPRVNLVNHSPNGFEWGYAGSGPAQLALALLADALGDDERAVRLHQKFKFLRTMRIRQDHWLMTDGEIRKLAEQIEQEKVHDCDER